jgi:hypothetical protein
MVPAFRRRAGLCALETSRVQTSTVGCTKKPGPSIALPRVVVARARFQSPSSARLSVQWPLAVTFTDL